MTQIEQTIRSSPSAKLALAQVSVATDPNIATLLTSLDSLYTRAEKINAAADFASRPTPPKDSFSPGLNAAGHLKLRKLYLQFNQLIEDTSEALDSINARLNQIRSPALNEAIKDRLGPVLHQIVRAATHNPKYLSWSVNLSGALSDLFSSLGLSRDERRPDAPVEIILKTATGKDFELYEKLLEAFGSCLEDGNYRSALAIRAFFAPDTSSRSTNERSRVDRIIDNLGDRLLEGLGSELAKLGGYLTSLGFKGRISKEHPLKRPTIKDRLAAIESIAKLLPRRRERGLTVFNGLSELATSLISLDIKYGFNNDNKLASERFLGVSTAIGVLKHLGDKEINSLVLATALNDRSLMIAVQDFVACSNQNLELAQRSGFKRSKIPQVVADSFLADWLIENMPIELEGPLPHSAIKHITPRAKVGSNIGMLCERLAQAGGATYNLNCIDIAYIPFIDALRAAGSTNSDRPGIIERVVTEAEARARSIFSVIRGITNECFSQESGADKASSMRLYTSLQLLISGFISASSDVDILVMAKELRAALDFSWAERFFNKVSRGSWEGLRSGLDKFLDRDFTGSGDIREARRELLRGEEFFKAVGVMVR